jgi:hypothetical protein
MANPDAIPVRHPQAHTFLQPCFNLSLLTSEQLRRADHPDTPVSMYAAYLAAARAAAPTVYDIIAL